MISNALLCIFRQGQRQRRLLHAYRTLLIAVVNASDKSMRALDRLAYHHYISPAVHRSALVDMIQAKHVL